MTAYRMTMITLLVSLFIASACGSDHDRAQSTEPHPSSPSAGEPSAPAASAVERGRYIVSTSGCHDCHTPLAMGPNGPAWDMTRMLSGHPASMVMPPPPPASGPWLVTVAATNTAWAGPWGVSFTANLTPDRETGLGTWTEQSFIDTIRNGRHMGAGRPLLPPMPTTMYANMTDGDLAAIFAYLKTVPALSNRVPDPISPAIASTPPTTEVARN